MKTALHNKAMVKLGLMFYTHHQEHHETIFHTLRCAKMIKAFGLYCGFDESDISLLEKGALLHDIGKFEVCGETLYASRKLTNTEFALIKQHPIMGHIEGFEPEALAMKEQHHEYLDGSGYPLGLKGAEIHPFAQMLTIVDVYDALKYARSYKKSWNNAEIFEEMMRYRGTRFNPIYLDAFFEFLLKAGFIEEPFDFSYKKAN